MLGCMGVSLLRTADLLERCYTYQLQSQSLGTTQTWRFSLRDGGPRIPNIPESSKTTRSKQSRQQDGSVELQAVLAKADTLLTSQSKTDRKAALCMLENSAEKSGDNAELLWRMARALHLSSFDDGDPMTRKELSSRALDCATKALAANSDNPHCHKWFAVTAGNAAEHSSSTRTKVDVIATFRKHMEKVLEWDPKDPVANHTMGCLALRISCMTWCERQIVATAFGTKLPQYTADQALEHLMVAEHNRPENAKTNQLCVAKCHLLQNNDTAAKAWLLKTKQTPAHHPSDVAAQEEIQTLLRKYEL